MSLNHLIQRELFSVCLCSKGGFLTFGQINSKFHLSDMKFTKMTSNSYTVALESAKISEEKVDLSISALVDSGSTNCVFPKKIASQIEKQVFSFADPAKITKKGKKVCFSGETSKFPVISFLIGKNTFPWEPNQYLSSAGCLQISVGSTNKAILGSSWMQNKEIVFDLESKEIGIALADCTHGGSLLPEPVSLLEDNVYWLYAVGIASYLVSVLSVAICLKK